MVNINSKTAMICKLATKITVMVDDWRTALLLKCCIINVYVSRNTEIKIIL